MLRKIIFSILALLTALLLGFTLYLTWISGHVTAHNSKRFGQPYDISFAKNHVAFVAYFCLEIFGAFYAVLGLLGLGWGLKGKRRYVAESSSADHGEATTDISATKTRSKIPMRYRLAAFVLGAMSIYFFCMAALLLQPTYRVAVNPHVVGRIERTWIITLPRGSRARLADVTFTVTRAGKPVLCNADAISIGSETFAADVGDSIELSPRPENCERPYVINNQPAKTQLFWLVGMMAATGLLCAVTAWRAFRGSIVSPRLRRALNTDIG
jgi:hypothetical protein